MKKLLLLFLLLQCYSQLKAQAYQPFPTSNTTWRVRVSTSNQTNYHLYSFLGDTIVNGFTYKKIYDIQYYNFPRYKGGIRELNKKIFFIPESAIRDTVLYDFNLTIGDTVKGYLMPPYCKGTVYSIDSINIESKWHKRFLIQSVTTGSCIFSTYLIEGVGCGSGLLEKYYIEFVTSDLVCVKQNNQTIFYPSTSYPCEDIIGINEHIKKEIVTMFPNPLIDKSNIDLSRISGQYKKIEIFNSLGQKVKEGNVNNASQYQLSREDFFPGYYLYKLSNSKEFVTGKFIVE